MPILFKILGYSFIIFINYIISYLLLESNNNYYLVLLFINYSLAFVLDEDILFRFDKAINYILSVVLSSFFILCFYLVFIY